MLFSAVGRDGGQNMLPVSCPYSDDLGKQCSYLAGADLFQLGQAVGGGGSEQARGFEITEVCVTM